MISFRVLRGCAILWASTFPSSSDCARTKLYNYFGYGSNVLPSTMTALRRVKPINATAAVLPNHALRFDGPGSRGIEPSAAFVTPCKSELVHGVLYTLTADDFASVGRTEGVPFGYRWKRCLVHPYVGNCERAGYQATLSAPPVEAYTLVSPALGEDDVPPSSSYLGIIIEGAKKWQFDRSYLDKLEAIPTAKNLIIRSGISRILLECAQRLST